MSDVAILTTSEVKPLSRQAREAVGRSAAGKVTGKLKAAIGYMVWDGLKRPEAAEKAGLSDHGLREAFRRPHVLAYYKAELEVLRTSERSRNIRVGVELRDASKQDSVRLKAAQWLHQEADQEASTASARTPGVVIIIGDKPAAHAASVANQPKPLISLDAVRTEDGERDD
jgi:hypothetical protein